MIYALDGQRATTPLRVPQTSGVHDPVTRHSPQARQKGSVYSCEDLQLDLLNRELCPVSPVSSRLHSNVHVRWSWEINRDVCWRGIYFLRPAAKFGRRGGGAVKPETEKQFDSKSYPFHAFQIALQQRVQSEDYIVAEALELEEDTKLNYKLSWTANR